MTLSAWCSLAIFPSPHTHFQKDWGGKGSFAPEALDLSYSWGIFQAQFWLCYRTKIMLVLSTICVLLYDQ